jgi:anaerobic ribonucleoside-triphosphate reductase activating protein
MNILATQYTLNYKSLDVYLAGCKGVNGVHCSGCHNPESWNFNQGNLYSQEYFKLLKQKVISFNNLIDNIMIFGGEPLDQNHEELLLMLKDLKTLNKSIWLFTGYNIEEIPLKIKENCNYIKCGRFIPELKTHENIMYGIKLATSNQTIYKVE